MKLVLETTKGEDIRFVAATLARISNTLEIEVETTFNDITVWCRPGEGQTFVLDLYDKSIAFLASKKA